MKEPLDIAHISPEPHPLPTLDAHEIIDKLNSLPHAHVHANVFGLETVDKSGEVGMLIIKEATPDDPNLVTTTSQLELISYQEHGTTHTVTLHSRHTNGFYSEGGPGENSSLFVVDTVTDEHGTTRLAATPEKLHHTSNQPSSLVDHDDGPLSYSVLAGLGVKGIMELITARQERDTETIARLEAALEPWLRRRTPEEFGAKPIGDTYWRLRGYVTPGLIALEQAQNNEWHNLPKVTRALAWLAFKGRPSAYPTAQEAYFARQGRAIQRDARAAKF